jgi:hypothetical protein
MNNGIVLKNIHFYSYWIQYPSDKLLREVGNRPNGSDGDAGPPGMLLNICTHVLDGGSLQFNCLLILTHAGFNIQIINAPRQPAVTPMRVRPTDVGPSQPMLG